VKLVRYFLKFLIYYKISPLLTKGDILKIKRDKVLHFFAGMFIFSLTLVILLFFAIANSFAWSLFTVIIIALTKEIYDYFNPQKHTAELADFIATIILPTLISLLWWYSNGY